MRKILVAVLVSILVIPLAAAQRQNPSQPLPTIESKTEGMTRMDGFFPIYWDEGAGRLWMEIGRFGVEVLHVAGLGAGLGSNDIGLDRGILAGSRIVRFDRVGPKVLMVQPNYRFRATSDNEAEVKAVTDAFAPSVLWGFGVGAATDDRVLVDMTEFVLRDATNAAARLRPGSYRFDRSRSAVYLPMTQNFPANTDLEVTLTFVRQPGGGPGDRGGRGGGGGFFEGVGSVAASAEAATIRVHHSFVQLPDDDYTPRAFDPRSGFGSAGFQDYSVALGQSMSRRFIRRHRLRRQDPSAPVSEAVEPIIYYLDPGTPEPIRSALLEGARWWNQAFEAAGYRDAFQVRIRPEDVSPLDIRYNVINWVHRSTRGWSTGGSVTDPRTGEIIKGVVTLGSLRVRQDYMIAEGLLAPYENGDEPAPELAEWALARIRQLSAHEVGHTLGLGHNYYDSRAGRISVLDYPHPLIRLNEDGSFDYSEVYDVGIGEWDKVAITYGYQDFPSGTDENAALTAILNEAWDRDLRYLTNQDLNVHPRVDQWSNGTDAAAELNRMMRVRRAALDRFGQNAIRPGRPMATLEEVLVPLYLHHRYQVDAAASVLGGQDYIYAFRGDGRRPLSRPTADRQQAALDALLATLDPAELKIPVEVLELIPPRPSGYRGGRELFPGYTGGAFDALTPAVVAAGHTVGDLLDQSRAARLVQQKMLDPTLPGLEDILRPLLQTTFASSAADAYEAEIARAVQRVVAEQLMRLAASAPMPQVRAIASGALSRLAQQLGSAAQTGELGDRAHRSLLSADITRFLNRPAEAYTQPAGRSIPPGAPIGQPAPEWLSYAPPYCSHPEW